MNDDDVFPIENGDIPAIAMLGLPKGTFCTTCFFFKNLLNMEVLLIKSRANLCRRKS